MTTTRTKITIGSLAAAVLISGGALLGSTATSEDQGTPASTAPSIQQTETPREETLDSNGAYFTDSIRAYTSKATDLWSDQELIAYGQAVCASLAADHQPDEFRSTMELYAPEAAVQPLPQDIEYVEVLAVQTWCPNDLQDYRSMRP